MIAASTANEKVVVFIGWILSFPRLVNSAIAGLKGEKTATGRSVLRPIQIRLTASSLIKSHRPVKRTGTYYEVRPRKDKRGVNLISDALRARIVFDCRMADDAASILCELGNMV